MNYKIEITGAILSIAVTIISWRVLIIPYGLFVALALGLIFFSVYRYMIREPELIYNLPSLKSEKKIFSGLIILSSLCVLFVNPVAEPVSLVAWSSVSVLNLLRLVLSSFLSLFSSGFMIVSIIDSNRKLTTLEKFLFSVTTSLFVLPFLGLLSFRIGSNIKQLGILFIVIFNLLLLLSYLFLERKKNNKITPINLSEKLILILLLTFIFTQFIVKYSSNLTWEFNDLDNYYGYAVAFTKDVLPLSPIGPGLLYPFWSSVFFAEFFILSGVPYVNAFQFILIPMSFLPIISFYIMVSAFFRKSKDRKIPIIATLISFFGGGFGWVFGINILFDNLTTQSLFKLFSIMARTNSGYTSPTIYSTGMTFIFFTYTLSSIFTLIWLIYSNHTIEIGNVRYFFISTIIALGYLSHIAEIAFFIFIFSTSLLIFKREEVSSFRKYALSIIFGYILVALADIIIQGSYYTQSIFFFRDQDVFSSLYYVLTLYYASIALTMLAYFLSFVKGRLKIPQMKFEMSRNKMRILKIVCSYGIIYLYGLCLVIWGQVYKTYNNLPTAAHTVPWYGWPNRFGLYGLIALIGMLYLINKTNSVKEHTFFIFLVPVTVVIARVLHIYPLYFEDRITFFIMIPAVIMASYILLKAVASLKRHFRRDIHTVIFGFVLLIILVSGFLPYSLLSIEGMDLGYWSNGQQLSNSELEALNFLRLNAPSNGSVLTLTQSSKWYLSYAGLSPVQTFYLDKDDSIIFSPIFPETAISSLAKSQLKYLYLTSADEKELEHNPNYSGFVKDNLLKYLPIAFQNEEVTIYEVPGFTIPQNLKTGVVTPTLSTGYFKSVFDERDAQTVRRSSVLATGDIITIKTDNATGVNHDFTLPVDINPAKYPYVTIRWKTDGSRLDFYLVGSKNVYSSTLGNSVNWQTTVINLDNFFDIVRKGVIELEPNELINTLVFNYRGLNSEYSVDSIQFSGFLNNDVADEFISYSAVALSQIEYSTVLENDAARFDYSNLILLHDLNLWNELEQQDFQRYMQWVNSGGRLIILDSFGDVPSKECRNLTIADYIGWADENFTTNWGTSACLATSDGDILTVKTYDTGIKQDLYSSSLTAKVGSFPYVVIRWKTDGSLIDFYPHGNETGYGYIRLGASTKWTTSVINLKDFYDVWLKKNIGFGDSEQIDGVLFRSSTKNATYSLDYIKFYKSYPLPRYTSFANLLSIYHNSTVNADGIKNQTSYFDFPRTISTPILHTSDTDTKISAYYTLNGESVSPYAFTKKVGRGEIIYLSVSPYISEIENSSSENRRYFFGDMGSLLNILDIGLSKNMAKRTNYFPQFDFIKNPVHLTGKVSIDTDYIDLLKFSANSITILSNNEEMKTMSLDNVIIDKVEYDYPIKFRIDTTEVNLHQFGLGSYSNIEIGDFILEMEIPENSQVKMSIWNSTTLIDETFRAGTVQMNITNIQKTPILVKKPTMTIEGNAFFNGARIYRNYYRAPLWYDDGTKAFEIIGNTSFTIEYSDNGINFVDDLTFNGTWFYPGTEQEPPSFTEMDIPWFNVLTSPFHILLVTVICTFSITYTYFALKKIKIRIKVNI